MHFYLNGKKHFGNAVATLLDCLEKDGLDLDEYEMERIIDLYMGDELPDSYYKNNILDIDEILKDSEGIMDII